jgi:hypothetical protein
VDRLNPVALAAALAQFVRNRNLGIWMGHNALLWSRNRFEVRVIAKRYIDLYEGLICGAIVLDSSDPSEPALLRQQMLESNRDTVERLVGNLPHKSLGCFLQPNT